LRERTDVLGDQLSEVLDLVEVRGVLTGGLAARGPWVSRAAIDHPLKFFAMLSGRATLTTDGTDVPIELEAGDVGILNNRPWAELRGGEGDGPRREITVDPEFPSASLVRADRGTDDVFVGGRIDLNAAGEAFLVDAFPPVFHLRASAAAASGLHAGLDRLFDELTGNRMGAAFAIRQHGQLLLLEMLRAYVAQAELSPGWLRLLADERLRPALRLMHDEPGQPWGLHELARAAAMSRTSFAERFRTVAGMPPLAYLSRWRMMLAQRALRHSDVRIVELASDLGYGSESAFSTAFKRAIGESPLRYRQRVRAASAVVTEPEPAAS
jgi:AraC-like DNA-binding protein